MSLFAETSTNNQENPAADEEHDYTSVTRHARDEPKIGNVSPLVAMVGRYWVNQAYHFFEELQTALNSIKILGNTTGRLWCMLDWTRYILSLWVKQWRQSDIPKDKWIPVVESWQIIIEATVFVCIHYSQPGRQSQRSTFERQEDSWCFKKSMYTLDLYTFLSEEEQLLVEAIIKEPQVPDHGSGSNIVSKTADLALDTQKGQILEVEDGNDNTPEIRNLEEATETCQTPGRGSADDQHKSEISYKMRNRKWADPLNYEDQFKVRDLGLELSACDRINFVRVKAKF